MVLGFLDDSDGLMGYERCFAFGRNSIWMGILGCIVGLDGVWHWDEMVGVQRCHSFRVYTH